MFRYVVDVNIFLMLTSATVLVVTEYSLHTIFPFFDGIFPDLIGRALSCTVTCVDRLLGIQLVNISMIDMRRYALVCLPIIVEPLIQLF